MIFKLKTHQSLEIYINTDHIIQVEHQNNAFLHIVFSNRNETHVSTLDAAELLEYLESQSQEWQAKKDLQKAALELLNELKNRRPPVQPDIMEILRDIRRQRPQPMEAPTDEHL